MPEYETFRRQCLQSVAVEPRKPTAGEFAIEFLMALCGILLCLSLLWVGR